MQSINILQYTVVSSLSSLLFFLGATKTFLIISTYFTVLPEDLEGSASNNFVLESKYKEEIRSLDSKQKLEFLMIMKSSCYYVMLLHFWGTSFQGCTCDRVSTSRSCSLLLTSMKRIIILISQEKKLMFYNEINPK